jgi:hypothetical protein
MVIRAVNPGDDPFIGLKSRQPRPDRVAIVMRAGEKKSLRLSSVPSSRPAGLSAVEWSDG